MDRQTASLIQRTALTGLAHAFAIAFTESNFGSQCRTELHSTGNKSGVDWHDKSSNWDLELYSTDFMSLVIHFRDRDLGWCHLITRGSTVISVTWDWGMPQIGSLSTLTGHDVASLDLFARMMSELQASMLRFCRSHRIALGRTLSGNLLRPAR